MLLTKTQIERYSWKVQKANRIKLRGSLAVIADKLLDHIAEQDKLIQVLKGELEDKSVANRPQTPANRPQTPEDMLTWIEMRIKDFREGGNG